MSNELPPLPLHWLKVTDPDGVEVRVFRAFQMRDYARAAVLQERESRADVRELVECLAAILQPGETGASIFASGMARKRGMQLLAKHNPLQALADNAREMGMTYEDGSKT